MNYACDIALINFKTKHTSFRAKTLKHIQELVKEFSPADRTIRGVTTPKGNLAFSIWGIYIPCPPQVESKVYNLLEADEKYKQDIHKIAMILSKIPRDTENYNCLPGSFKRFMNPAYRTNTEETINYLSEKEYKLLDELSSYWLTYYLINGR